MRWVVTQNGRIFFDLFLVLSADRAAGLHIHVSGGIPGESGAAMGRYSARDIYAACADPDLYLPEYGRGQCVVYRPHGRDDPGVFRREPGDGEAQEASERRLTGG